MFEEIDSDLDIHKRISELEERMYKLETGEYNSYRIYTKIHLIKLYRKLTGSSLRDSKNGVEELIRSGYLPDN